MRLRGINPPEVWRVLAYTLALALAFVGLGQLQRALFELPATQGWLQRFGLLDAEPATALEQERAAIAQASRAALARLPAGHRSAALRLGYELGYTSQLVGALALAPAEVQALGEQQAEPHRRRAAEIAQQWQLGAAAALPARSLREFTELGARYEADESGLAARVEQRLSPLHRELYLLGVHLGGAAAQVQSSDGQFALPAAALIRRHATRAGIEPRWWAPLAAPPAHDEAPAQIVARYAAALQALGAELERQDAAAPPAPTPP